MVDANKGYETRIVIMLALLWGIVGFDRLVITYLFPIIGPEFGLSNTQLGSIASILALTWALSAWFLGGVSDKLGRKKILLGSTIFFSVMSWVTGVAQNFVQMLLVRGLLGVGEGGVFSTSVATLSAESSPKRIGFNMGLHQAFFPLLGIAFGALITGVMLEYFSWRVVFFIAGIPGIVMAIVLWLFMREPARVAPPAAAVESADKPDQPSMFAALSYRNVQVSSFISILFMSWLFVFSSFAVTFMTTERGIELGTALNVMSGWGFGGFIGMIAVPTISDFLGRKPTITISTILAGATVLGFIYLGESNTAAFFWLFLSGIFGFGIAPIFLSLSTTESVPANLAGSAVGTPTAIGELFGAVLMPVIAGALADSFGLIAAMLIAGVVPLVGGAAGLLYHETAPRALARRGSAV